MSRLVDKVSSRLAPFVVVTILTVGATLPTAAAAEHKPWPINTDDGWTNRENTVWNELAARYGSGDVLIARNMFPRTSVDMYEYREAVDWLQEQQDARLDRDKGTNTVRQRWPY